ncbi:MAG: hypothetical protein NZO16_01510 [Deltaproteobacteria bacterium]|nr:hypothetical protein [Deltaproteobacteria bacterium]
MFVDFDGMVKEGFYPIFAKKTKVRLDSFDVKPWKCSLILKQYSATFWFFFDFSQGRVSIKTCSQIGY